MNRREFVKAMAAGGVMMSMPTSFALANGAKPNRYFVQIYVGGGWDVTSICDPKGNNVESSSGRGPINKFETSAIRKSGNLRYAPMASGAISGTDWMDTVYKNHRNRILVLNGVNMLSGSHSQGQYYFTNGQNFPAFPTLCALHAAPYNGKTAVPYYSSGNIISSTGGEVSKVSISSASALDKLVESSNTQPSAIQKMMYTKRQELLDHLGYDPESPSAAETWRQFSESEAGTANIVAIKNKMPANPSSGKLFNPEMVAALLASGECASAGFACGENFDTHHDNDIGQSSKANSLFQQINYLWAELERHGIADKTTVMIGSEMGRTPWYNGNNGKDHWATGSVIIMADGIGNRMIGDSGRDLRPGKVNVDTLEPDENGIEITIQHIHRALRDRLGLQVGTALNSKYPMPVESLSLFG